MARFWALHRWHCTGDTAQVALQRWHCTGDTAQVALHRWHCTIDTAQLTLCRWHCTVQGALLNRVRYCTGCATAQGALLHRVRYCTGCATAQGALLHRVHYCTGCTTAKVALRALPFYLLWGWVGKATNRVTRRLKSRPFFKVAKTVAKPKHATYLLKSSIRKSKHLHQTILKLQIPTTNHVLKQPN